MKEVSALNCEREADLVGYLYGEMTEAESTVFQNHLHNCQACKTELAGLRTVRKSVVVWRNESLAGVDLPAYTPLAHEAARPSALAALREFFNLSPLWLKGAVAFASILLCLLAGLAVARLRTTSAPNMVAQSPDNAVSEERVKALVEQRVKEELQRIKASAEPTISTVATVDTTKAAPRRRVGGRSLASVDPIQRARRPLTKTERDQLAADLRLAALNDSEFDLIDDSVNQ